MRGAAFLVWSAAVQTRKPQGPTIDTKVGTWAEADPFEYLNYAIEQGYGSWSRRAIDKIKADNAGELPKRQDGWQDEGREIRRPLYEPGARARKYNWRGGVYSIAQISAITGINPLTIKSRLRYGYTIEEASQPEPKPQAGRPLKITTRSHHMPPSPTSDDLLSIVRSS